MHSHRDFSNASDPTLFSGLDKLYTIGGFRLGQSRHKKPFRRCIAISRARDQSIVTTNLVREYRVSTPHWTRFSCRQSCDPKV